MGSEMCIRDRVRADLDDRPLTFRGVAVSAVREEWLKLYFALAEENSATRAAAAAVPARIESKTNA